MTRSFALLALAFAGCAGAQHPDGLDPARLSPEVLYPLAEGNVWSYDVNTGIDGELPTLAITRVVSAAGNRFEVSNNNSDPIPYELREDGIYRPATSTWLLRAPIRTGEEWPSTGGRTARVTSIDETMHTAAGDFEGCVRVEESGGEVRPATDGDPGLPADIDTVYCPNVGPVFVQSSMLSSIGAASARVVARLRGYALAEE